ncbi:MAG: alginate export family protein [Thermodesulfovibrionales bacterium]
MLKRVLVVCMLVLLGAMLYVPYADAETKLDYGAAFRLRQENWDDVVNLSTNDTGGGADRNFFRLRTQVWGKAQFNENLGVFARLVNEAKFFDGPFLAYKTNVNRDRFDPDELNIDNLYFDAKNIFNLPIDVRIGRQDFLGPDFYGEGFLIVDGTPGDGSKTFYFNAIKAKVRFSKEHTLDVVYINNPKTDTYLPSLHPSVKGGLFIDNKKVLTASREQGLVLYGRSKVSDKVLIEPYYMYKSEDAFGAVTKLELNTIGARVVVTADSWKFGGEYAHQFGDYANGTDRTGNGGYIFVGRKYEKAALKPEFDLRFVYLSGNDPSTAENETFNPLFSRNPSWNELIIYPLLNETAAYGGAGMPGYWTNMEILKATVSLNFSPATRLNLAYQYLFAPEESGISNALFTNNGKSRGHLPTAIMTHAFSKNLDAMVQLEYFIPGSYYTSASDNASFFRWQLQYRL